CMSASAPIVLFAYNRPRHLRQALDALAANEGAQDSELLAFCDGPRPSAEPGELRRIEEVRAIVRQERRFAHVAVVEREGNLGLARSVIEGVTTALSRHDRVIVVEDDIVSSRGFLRYMNAALAMYADDDRVGCIHAWNFHVDTSGCPDTTFFLKGADCWG